MAKEIPLPINCPNCQTALVFVNTVNNFQFSAQGKLVKCNNCYFTGTYKG